MVITSYENVAEDEELDIRGASHPLPDASGEIAAQALLERVKQAEQGELVLCLISGGASALLPLPSGGLSLEDKIATTELLLASGADITEINSVRKHMSRIKGGQLARQSMPAEVHSLILSDVLGDDLSAIASGPTVPDNTTFADAWRVFEKRGLVDQLPVTVRDHLQSGLNNPDPETPKSDNPLFRKVSNTLVGSNRISVEAVSSI